MKRGPKAMTPAQPPTPVILPPRCPACGSPIDFSTDISIVYTCGAWINRDGSKSNPLPCHAKRVAAKKEACPMTTDQEAVLAAGKIIQQRDAVIAGLLARNAELVSCLRSITGKHTFADLRTAQELIDENTEENPILKGNEP